MDGHEDTTVLPLHTVEVDDRAKLNLPYTIIYIFAIMALIYHRLLHLLNSPDLLSFSLFLAMLIAELVFTFVWALTQALKFRPVRRRTFPERLVRKFDDKEFPSIDVFVCTADPLKEPPISVVNTTLSAMAFDYPAEKLSVYVSDDGGSELTLFAFMEAARFAKHWLPFCKEHGIETRCPQVYFSDDCSNCRTEERERMKLMYKKMEEKIESIMRRGSVTSDDIIIKEEHDAFRKWTSSFTRQHHPTIIQVILDGVEDLDASGHSLPKLVYISREKSRMVPHNFKAGSLNVLLRVSAVMSNAPIVVNLDCDMYVNDPQAPLRAICHLLDPINGQDLALVQFPQRFYGINRSDIYDSELKQGFDIHMRGMDGLRGVFYFGSGGFFFRKVFFGSPSQVLLDSHQNCTIKNGSIRSETILREAYKVSGCTYEQGGDWGSKIGFRYGVLVEDFFTSYCLYRQGWRTIYCNETKPAFLGNTPINLNDNLSQYKRWMLGLFDVSFSRYCPLSLTLGNLSMVSVLMGMCYAYYSFWGITAIPVTIYAIIPQLTLANGISIFPKISDPWFYLYLFLFMCSCGQELVEHLKFGGTFDRWWNYQRMWMIKAVSPNLFALGEFFLKLIGMASVEFNVTSKAVEDEQRQRYEQEKFEFGVASPFFMPLATIAIISLVSFTRGLARVVQQEGNLDKMFVQLFISGFAMVNSWPIYDAMLFRRDKGKMPLIITAMSIFLACVLCFLGDLILMRFEP